MQGSARAPGRGAPSTWTSVLPWSSRVNSCLLPSRKRRRPPCSHGTSVGLPKPRRTGGAPLSLPGILFWDFFCFVFERRRVRRCTSGGRAEGRGRDSQAGPAPSTEAQEPEIMSLTHGATPAPSVGIPRPPARIFPPLAPSKRGRYYLHLCAQLSAPSCCPSAFPEAPQDVRRLCWWVPEIPRPGKGGE